MIAACTLRDMNGQIEPTRSKSPSVLKKGLAGVVLVVVAALVLKALIGFVIAIFGVIVLVAVIVAVLWALKTIVW